MQNVVRHLVQFDVRPDFFFRPVRQRVVFLQTVAFVKGSGRQAFAGGGLLRTQAGDPGLFAGQRALQRLDLARMATGLAQFGRFVKSVDSVLPRVLLDQLVARIVELERQPVVLFHFGDQVVGFQWQAAGVERKNLDVELLTEDQVGEHHVFGAEAVGKCGRGKFAGDLPEQGACAYGFCGDGIKQCLIVQIDGNSHVVLLRAAAEQRLRLIDGGLVTLAEGRESGQCRFDVLVLAHGEGVKAATSEQE